MFGNVNVDYKPCYNMKSVKDTAEYILGIRYDQIKKGVEKTSENLCTAFDCDIRKFPEEIALTRQLNGKENVSKKKQIFAFKISVSWHPDDNDKLSYEECFKMAEEFAEKFFHSKGYDVLTAVHTDTEHKHAHFLIGNCNRNTGKAFRRNQRDLYEMSEFFGQQCEKRGLVNSVRESFYHQSDPEVSHEKKTQAEINMKKFRNKDSFKDELREVIDIELRNPNNKTFDDIIEAIKKYGVTARVAGKTISYQHPVFTTKTGKPASVRGSRLGEKYTKGGIENVLANRTAERGTEQNNQLRRNASGTGKEVAADSFAYSSGKRTDRERRDMQNSYSNNSQYVQSLDELYKGYTTGNREAERKSAEADRTSKSVRRKHREDCL